MACSSGYNGGPLSLTRDILGGCEVLLPSAGSVDSDCRRARKLRPVVTGSASEARPLTVPGRHVEVFESIREMKESDFSDLLTALNAAESTARLSALEETILEGSQLDASDVRSLLDAILGLGGLGYRLRESASRVAARVALSPQFDATEGLGEDEQLGECLADRIKALLNCDVVRLLSKVSSVGAEHERVFLNAQVLTDLRPIFDDDSDNNLEPEGALLSHTLSLHFIRSDRTHDNFYVVLDEDDIEILQQAIDRAMKKSEALKRKLQASGLVHMIPE